MAKAATPRVKSGDFTGKQREDMMKENAAEVVERSKQVSMATAQQAKEFAENVHDPRTHTDVIVEDVEDMGGVTMSDQGSVVIRVNEDIDEMTFGYGNTYTMKAGGQYRVPKPVADHLESLGLQWH